MTWAPLDLAELVDQVANGIDGRPVPAVLTRDDGAGLIYPGMVNGVHGESGSGKTWLALHACVQQLVAGHRVVYIDHEGDPRSIVARLLDLGLTADTIIRGFHYVQPETPFTDGGTALLEAVRMTEASLVVIDSTGEGLALGGAKPNADDEVALWFREVPRRIADQGPAVLLLDHTAKAHGGELWPIGSQRKRAAINGAQFYIETMSPFSRDRAGAAKLVCAKDRHGCYTFGQRVGILHVTPDDGTLAVSIAAPDPAERAPDGGFRPTGYMEKISRLLEANDAPMSGKQIRDSITGKSQHIGQAVAALVAEGHLTTAPGGRGAILHTVVNPYREHVTTAEQVPDPPNDLFLFPVPRPGTGEQVRSAVPGTPGNSSGTAHDQKEGTQP